LARRRLLAPIASLALLLAAGGSATADTGPHAPSTDILQARIPISYLGSDGRTYTGEALVQRDLINGTTVAGFYWSWRNLVNCDNGTPEPDDDFQGEELIDFTVDSIVPTSFAIASNLSSSSGVLTKSGHLIHLAACDGSTISDVVESHTVSFGVASTGPATKSNSRERIDNGDGTVTTIVVRETHRPASGSLTINVAGTVAPAVGSDLAHVEVTETTR